MLTLPIRRYWFDMIITGQKPEEYRDITPYYEVRFNRYNGRPFTLRYRAGYRANSPLLQCTATVRQGVGRIEWGAVPGQQYFVLDLRDVQIIEAKKTGEER